MRLLIGFLFIHLWSGAQIGTGQWRLHTPNKAIDVVATDEVIYTAYEMGLGEYHIASGEVSVWDAVSGLSDISVSCLGKCISDNSIFIAYENGNLDKLKNNEITNIPAIKLAELQGSKMIYKMVEYEGHMYLATGFSIVKIDPVKNEVRDTYYPTSGNAPIRDIVFKNDSIYALAEDRLYKGYIDNVALADPAQWIVDTRLLAPLGGPYSDIELLGSDMYVLSKEDLYGGDTLIQITSSSAVVVEPLPQIISEIRSLNTVNDRLAVNYAGGAVLFEENLVEVQTLSNYSDGAFPSPLNVSFDNDVYWIADQISGLVEYNAAYSTKKIAIDGPPFNTYWGMGYNEGEIAFTSGGLSGSQPIFSNKGISTFKDEAWTAYDRDNISEWDTQFLFDYIAVAINPLDPTEIAVGTYSHIPLSLLNTSTLTADTITPLNSDLEYTYLGNNWSYISDLRYDNAGNLWIANGLGLQPLKVLTNEGIWHSFSLGPAANNKFTDDMVIDYNGNVWVAVRDAGLFGFKDNGTIDDPTDDLVVNLNMGANTGALPSGEVTAIAVDFDNEIWIGTDVGFAVLYNSDNAFEAGLGDYNAQRIKLEFEGNVEYVLGSTNITDIEVDGANRKWFATANSGLVLLSADGLEIIEQFTAENSPLISNKIQELQLNHETGELFIITDLGLVSYRTDASWGEETYDNVTVFPNPVRPDYTGPITIQGIKYDSDVRITDAAGNLVYKTTSNGGTATWDGQTITGEQVSTGVYLIWTATNTGKGRKVGKVAVIR